MLLRYLTGVPMGYLDTYHHSFAQYKGPFQIQWWLVQMLLYLPMVVNCRQQPSYCNWGLGTLLV